MSGSVALLSVGERWKRGVPHDHRSIAVYKSIAKIDFEQCSDSFCFKDGGDGDNGETLMYLLDVHFQQIDGAKDADLDVFECRACGGMFLPRKDGLPRGHGGPKGSECRHPTEAGQDAGCAEDVNAEHAKTIAGLLACIADAVGVLGQKDGLGYLQQLVEWLATGEPAVIVAATNEDAKVLRAYTVVGTGQSLTLTTRETAAFGRATIMSRIEYEGQTDDG